MNLIKASLERPIAIVSVIIMTIILGVVALERIPIQIAPDVNKPVISVTTYWYGASPYEMEREIVNKQEEALQGVEGAKRITAETREGRAKLEIEFSISTNMDRALMLVSNRLNQIDDYPADAGEPTLDTSGLDDNAIAWFILTRVVYPINFTSSDETRATLSKMLSDMGPVSKDELRVGIVFFVAAGLWMFRSLVDNYIIGLTDAGIAIIVAISLFIIPSSGRNGELLSWEQSSKLPWGLLLLFGGGLSLGVQINNTGLGLWIGESLLGLQTVPLIVLVMAVAALIIFLTEVTSNVATTSTFLPVFGAVAVAVGVAPEVLTVPVVLAASCAFMLPVATPPNAIVYGANKFKIIDMMRAGFFINIVGIFVVTIFAYYFAKVIF